MSEPKNGEWLPLTNRSPYPRIDLYGPKPVEPVTQAGIVAQELEQKLRIEEGERIWRYVVESAQGNG